VDEFSKPLAGSVALDRSDAGIEGEAVSEAELREFLAADAFGAPANPEFKHKLQGRLWDIVQTRLQKKRRHKWMHGWRRRNIPPAEENDESADLER
jgi:hypothetical protein